MTLNTADLGLLEAFASFVKSKDAGHSAPQILYVDATLSEATGDIGFRQIAPVMLAKHVTYVLLMLARIQNHICFVKIFTAQATTVLIAIAYMQPPTSCPHKLHTTISGHYTACGCNAGRVTACSCNAKTH